MLNGQAVRYEYLRESIDEGNEAAETSTPIKQSKCSKVFAEALPSEMPETTFSDEANEALPPEMPENTFSYEANEERTSETDENQFLDNVSNQYLLSIVIATFYSYRVQGKLLFSFYAVSAL